MYLYRIVVYSPQIYENYYLQSGEGLSILFVIVWLLGDLSNLFGAVMGGLLPTVIILALYVSTWIASHMKVIY
jgi:solute carrier family 66 (lysosomal lysine-arginine transporter), member 1